MISPKLLQLSLTPGVDGYYKYYNKPNMTPISASDYQVVLISAWGSMFFTAFNACWVHIDYDREESKVVATQDAMESKMRDINMADVVGMC